MKHWSRVPEDIAARVRSLSAAASALERTPDALESAETLGASCTWCGEACLPNMREVRSHFSHQ